MSAHPGALNALSVDLEEYYHGLEFEAALGPGEIGRLPSRVEHSVDRVLDLFDRGGAQATFFVVGTVAEAHPGLVRRIAAAGHEVACHGYRHQLVSRMRPEEFQEDIRCARAVLSELSGRAVVGFRAPNYSIGHQQTWAYDILLEEGFRYDSSVYPIRHDRYGLPAAPRFPYEIWRRGKDVLMEFPIGTLRMFGVNLPIGGGGYFRLLPGFLTRRGIERVNAAEGRGVMFYFHPWEMDPGQPRPPMPLHHRLRHYTNLDGFERKVEDLLRSVRFASAREVLGLSEPPAAGAPAPAPATAAATTVTSPAAMAASVSPPAIAAPAGRP